LSQYEKESDMSAIAGPCPPQCLERLEDVAELYASQAVRVRRLVRLSVQAPDAVIEDACQIAWMRLVRHRTRVRRDSASRWVVRVAVNEAFKLVRRTAHDVSLDALVEDVGAAPLAAPDLLEDLAEQRAQLEAIGGLPARQQRLVWLQALGFSYAEMAGETGDSNRTVERQLLRAKRTLAQREAA
jgi:RNA polymerase sigma factor (sigma-70 family)